MKKYDHKKIETKWQKVWAKNKTFETAEKSDKKKSYILDMFPYPSGEGLHVGHPKGFIATDIISRMNRMQGRNVLHPMGFDAFGLPAENYAIKTKTHPEEAVKKNIKRYKKQLEILGFDYDWSREINTTDPEYYKWTQWIFLQMYKKGLAYESHEPINWCPSCQTGLANEDLEGGLCERCGSVVEKRPIRQWVLKITDYADRLLEDLNAFNESEVPVAIDIKNPPVKGKKSVPRRTIHALVIDPKTEKILCIKWKKFPWTGFVVGGVEDGEDVVEAARREVREETGYSDLKFVKILGGVVRGEYFAAHKDENRIAYSNAILFELQSDKQEPLGEEEKAKHEPVWLDPKTLNRENFTCAELNIWLSRMSVDVNYQENGSKIPLFTQITESSAFKEGQPIAERNAVAVIVKHWSENKYIGLKWKKVPWRTIITGGPDGDETAEEGARKEIVEETGYLNPKFVRHLGKVDAKFFHVPKNTNRLAHFDVMYFELENGEKEDLTAEEMSNHEVLWLNPEEMSEFITPASQKYMWDTLFLGKPNEFLNDTKLLLDWPESIKESQRNWIGRSVGMLFEAPIKDTDLKIQTFSAHFEAFAADTFVVIAPDHPRLEEIVDGVSNKEEILSFAKKLTDKRVAQGFTIAKEPEGIFTGRYVVDPVGNGDLPIWVANYALAEYGTGIVKCSVHDERDFAFAKKYNIKLKPVLFPEDADEKKKVEDLEVCYTDMKNGILGAPKEFEGQKAGDVREKIVEYLEKNNLAKRKVTYRLKDWVFSRQRYWGEPVPIIHCRGCWEAQMSNDKFQKNAMKEGVDYVVINNLEYKIVPVPEEDLPVKLPKVKHYEPTGTGESPLANIEDWVNVKCPSCGGSGKRETNTMPQWAGSSWYHIAYIISKNLNVKVPISKQIHESRILNQLVEWLPVDIYVGGAEHATRHLIYARFWHKFLYDIGIVKDTEPFLKLRNVGLILAEDGRKMSKRFGNVVNPDDVVKTWGADTMRIYEMFLGPFGQSASWSTNNMMGARRFVEKVWRLQEKVTENSKINPELEILLNKTIKKVGDDILNFSFNTAISTMMILVNELEKQEDISEEIYKKLLKLLAPFAPHITEEIWESLGEKESIHLSSWPEYDQKLTISEQVKIIVQVDGKVRATIDVNRGESEGSVKTKALSLDSIQKWLNKATVEKVIFVPDRLINFVLTK